MSALDLVFGSAVNEEARLLLVAIAEHLDV
jgi:hypothetical protein